MTPEERAEQVRIDWVPSPERLEAYIATAIRDVAAELERITAVLRSLGVILTAEGAKLNIAWGAA